MPADTDDASTRTQSDSDETARRNPVESIVTKCRAVPGRERLTIRDVGAGFVRISRARSVPVGLVGALLVGCLVVGSYLLTHPYPAYGAGLYLHIAERIAANGFALPVRITRYAGIMPMAYPPLGFYLAALATAVVGVDPLTYSLVVPGVVAVLTLVPFWAFAAELLESRRQAAIATALLATTPETLQWHLSAGGIVRGVAFFLAVCGLYVAVRVFSKQRWRWVTAGALLFALTMLTHPVYTVFFGLSWVVIYCFVDRTPRGLAAGTIVAAAGVLLASPWWVQVVATHGPDAFLGAGGTHGGLGGGFDRLLHSFVHPLDWSVTAGYYLLVYAATAAFLAERRLLLPVWLLTVGYVLGKPRFLFLPGTLMVAVVTVERVVPWLRRQAVNPPQMVTARTDGGAERERTSWTERVGLGSGGDQSERTSDARREWLSTLPVVLLLVAATSVGGLYAGGALPNAHAGSPSQPQFIDSADREAMAWAENNTASDASFLVAGDAAEWLPLLADRPITVGPWGVEWTTPAQYERQLETFEAVAACQDAACLSRERPTTTDPDYVYVPLGTYTVRGDEQTRSSTMYTSMVESEEYRLAYRNDGVAIFRVDDGDD